MFLTRDELTKIIKKYSKNGEINYTRISNELGLHKTSFDYMKSSHKYLKNSSILKSIQGGLNDTKSQFVDILKNPHTERTNRQSTKGAIKFMLESKKADIEKLITGIDKTHTGTINRADFSKILNTMGVYISQSAFKDYNVKGDQIDYNSFILGHTVY